MYSKRTRTGKKATRQACLCIPNYLMNYNFELSFQVSLVRKPFNEDFASTCLYLCKKSQRKELPLQEIATHKIALTLHVLSVPWANGRVPINEPSQL
jgi:hypothetical protein